MFIKDIGLSALIVHLDEAKSLYIRSSIRDFHVFQIFCPFSGSRLPKKGENFKCKIILIFTAVSHFTAGLMELIIIGLINNFKRLPTSTVAKLNSVIIIIIIMNNEKNIDDKSNTSL